MSERQSDSYDSRPVTSKRSERPPFKLCFSRNQQIGRSNACVSKANGILCIFEDSTAASRRFENLSSTSFSTAEKNHCSSKRKTKDSGLTAKDTLERTCHAPCINLQTDFITPKFYSRELEEMQRNADVAETIEKIVAAENKDPRDSHRLPLLTSHMYGWWHNKGIYPKDPRFNFHKRTSDLVSFQMRIYAEERRLKGLQH